MGTPENDAATLYLTQPEVESRCKARWARTCALLPRSANDLSEIAELSPPQRACWERLRAAYCEPQRRYHTLGHVLAMFEYLDAHPERSNDQQGDGAQALARAGGGTLALELAVW